MIRRCLIAVTLAAAPPKAVFLAQADFDEDEHFPVAADEVDFATAAPVVARDDPELFLLQKARRQVLGLPAGAAARLSRGIVVAH